MMGDSLLLVRVSLKMACPRLPLNGGMGEWEKMENCLLLLSKEAPL